MKKLAILLSALLAASSASAVPVEEDPCVAEKVLVTKKQSRKPAKKSEIAAWIVVRSGGPANPDAPRCLDETPIFDLPEPELVSWEPQALLPAVPEYEEPEEPMVDWPPLLHFWDHRYAPRYVGATTVPEPSTGLLLLSLGALLIARAEVRRG